LAAEGIAAHWREGDQRQSHLLDLFATPIFLLTCQACKAAINGKLLSEQALPNRVAGKKILALKSVIQLLQQYNFVYSEVLQAI